jgi:hypothetical protein
MARSAVRKSETLQESESEVSPLVGPIMASAEEQGLFATNESRVTARVSRKLIDAAKARTGIKSDSELVKFAIAQLALDDPFRRAFREVGGTVDPSLDLEF